MLRIRHTGSLPDLAREALRRDGFVYLEDVGGEDELLSLADQLGAVGAPGVWRSASNLHDGRIYSVEVRNGGRGELDDHGHVIVSSTNRAFPLHTDGYNKDRPPRYVLLLRTDDGPDDTHSFVSDVVEALEHLRPATAALLERGVFPSALGPVPLLERDEEGTPRLRLNETEIERWAAAHELNPAMGESAREAVAELCRCLRDRQLTLTIGPAGCLVLDNWRVCHGRSPIPSGSGRTLKRVWVA